MASSWCGFEVEPHRGGWLRALVRKMSFFSTVQIAKMSYRIGYCRLSGGARSTRNILTRTRGFELKFPEMRLLVVGKMSYHEMLTSAESYLGASEIPSLFCG